MIRAAVLFCLLAPSSWGDDPGDEIPQVGRPAEIPFSEASGSFRIETDVDREIVPVDDPILLIVRIIATGPVRLPPQRIPLGEIPAFPKQFRIEDVANDLPDVLQATRLVGLSMGAAWNNLLGAAPPEEWEFHYRLRPRSMDVRSIPDVPLAFFNPRLQRFQVHYADKIPIEVRPREQVEVALQIPTWAEVLNTGPSVRQQWRDFDWPSPWWLVVPPLGCLIWYLTWFLSNPDQARLAHQRRSRAAREALRMLKRRPKDPRQEAFLATGAVTHYLHQRHGVPEGEPTPRELADHLRRLGWPPERVAETCQFFSTCASVRFQPQSNPAPTDLAREAGQLILSLEQKA